MKANNVDAKVIFEQRTSGSSAEFAIWSSSTGIYLQRSSTTSTIPLTVDQWYYVEFSRVGDVFSLTANGSTVAFTQSGSIGTSNTHLFTATGYSGFWWGGGMSSLSITTGGVTTHFPLQDGPGSSNTNRDLSYIKSDGTYGVVSGAIVNGTVSTIWANRCPYAEDWCVNYGGDIAANGSFLPGQISGSLAADGTAKTLSAGKFGNPYSRVNFNPFTAAELNGLGIETEYAVGANSGTLTNMDAATDWVADTDAGGVRALDFDGVDDFVLCTGAVVDSPLLSISIWYYLKNITDVRMLFCGGDETNGKRRGILARQNRLEFNGLSADWPVTGTGPVNLVANAWGHAVVTINVSTRGIVIFVNGSLSTSGTANNALLSGVANLVNIGSNRSGTENKACKIDDIRIFNTTLNADDVAYLYNSGTGRGIVSSNYAVNGKIPVAAWIPSRDTVGNGTLRLANLVGTARQSVSPADTKFRRTATAGDDRFITVGTALTGTDKTNTEGYVA
jgi:hypothetical protein